MAPHDRKAFLLWRLLWCFGGRGCWYRGGCLAFLPDAALLLIDAVEQPVRGRVSSPEAGADAAADGQV